MTSQSVFSRIVRTNYIASSHHSRAKFAEELGINPAKVNVHRLFYCASDEIRINLTSQLSAGLHESFPRLIALGIEHTPLTQVKDLSGKRIPHPLDWSLTNRAMFQLKSGKWARPPVLSVRARNWTPEDGEHGIQLCESLHDMPRNLIFLDDFAIAERDGYSMPVKVLHRFNEYLQNLETAPDHTFNYFATQSHWSCPQPRNHSYSLFEESDDDGFFERMRLSNPMGGMNGPGNRPVWQS